MSASNKGLSRSSKERCSGKGRPPLIEEGADAHGNGLFSSKGLSLSTKGLVHSRRGLIRSGRDSHRLSSKGLNRWRMRLIRLRRGPDRGRG